MSPLVRSLFLSGLLVCLGAAGCSEDEPLALEDNPLCAFECPARGIERGNAAISGVPSVDTFFAAVAAHTTVADQAAAALEDTLAKLRARFSVSANAALGTQLLQRGKSLLGDAPSVASRAALCWVDTGRLLLLQSACDTDLAPGESLRCFGPCRVDPGTDCGRTAVLQCTQNAAGIDCGKGKCSGSCRSALNQGGRCVGVCEGQCDGQCDRYSRDADGMLQCAGRCAGECRGQCERAIDEATCTGTCTGSCRQDNPMECEGAVETRCQPENNGGSFECPGECGGRFDPQAGKGECAAAAQAQASYLARCDSPAVSVHYALSESSISLDQHGYLNALNALSAQLPGLLSAVARAELIKGAGQELAAAAKTKVKDSLRSQAKSKELDVQTRIGLDCALSEVEQVGKALDPAQRRLSAALLDARELLDALKID